MSALLKELATNGVSSEDIEKAAAARLFEKTAAAEGIDLGSMNEDQQDQLFDHFVDNVLPGMVSGKTASADADDEFVAAVMAKVASLDDDTKIFLFEKQAAYEDLDLEAFEDDSLKVAYGYFCENVLPQMVVNDGEVVQVEKVAETEKVAEAQAKLAEAEILGRHMARAFVDEQGKYAEDFGPGFREAGEQAGASVADSWTRAKDLGGKGLALVKKYPKSTAALTTAGLVGGGIGAKKLYDRRQDRRQDAQKAADAPILEALAMQKAAEILEANGIDPTTGEAKQASIDEVVDGRAIELLQNAGYEFE